MWYKRKMPVEVAGYRNVLVPAFDPRKNCVVDKWFSLADDIHADDDLIPWDSDDESSIPPF